MEYGLGPEDFNAFAKAWLGGLAKSGVLAIGADEALIREYRGSGMAEDFVRDVVTFLTGSDPARLAYLSPSRPIPDASKTHPFKLAYEFIDPIVATNLAGLEERFALEVGRLTDPIINTARHREGLGDYPPVDAQVGPPSPGRMAGRMVGLLFRDRANHALLTPDVRPGPTPQMQRVAKILRAFRSQGYLDPSVDIDELAAERDWRTLGNDLEDKIAQTVAKRLGSSCRELLAPGVEPPQIAMSDPFYNARLATSRSPQQQAARDELIDSGRYNF